MKERIECAKCGWVGEYSDLVAPTSDHEPSCPECLGDDFVEVEDDPDREEGVFKEIRCDTTGGVV